MSLLYKKALSDGTHIAYLVLDDDTLWAQGIYSISLEATDMGKPLYEKYGFVKMNDEMELQWEI